MIKTFYWVDIDIEKQKLRDQMGLNTLNSPSHKRWILNIMHIDVCNVIVNTLRIPPREYVHKNETQRN